MFFPNLLLVNWERILLLLLLSTVKVIRTTMLAICDEQIRYEYDMDQCPGGIQIRDIDQWFSKSREQTCICGEGSLLQFNGKTEQWPHKQNSSVLPEELKSTEVGSWTDYSLTPACEVLKGMESSALLINAKKYENPANLPSRAIELHLETFQPTRLAGVYKISERSGYNHRDEVSSPQLLRTVIFNNQQPLLIVDDANAEFPEHVCSYNSTSPEVVLANYITTTWGNQDLVQSCESKVYKSYNRVKEICTMNCETSKKFVEETPSEQTGNQSELQFREIFTTMGEVAIRLKYLEKIVYFQYEDHPYAAILQSSCRVFYRAFPTIIRWETLMNAVALFGIVFEGMIPTYIEKHIFDEMKILLGRCAIQQGRRQKQYNDLLPELCGSAEPELNRSAAANANSNPKKGTRSIANNNAEGEDGVAQQKTWTNSGGHHNIVIELLWKVVQFVHSSCLSSTDHYPNVHHAYTSAMIEMFSTPAVQLLWYQQGKHNDVKFVKTMVHIFPELSDHVLPTMTLLLGKLRFETHFSLLRRPKVPNLDDRDMRCAAHGKLIFGGKACCYQKSEDKKFYYFHKVAFAKL